MPTLQRNLLPVASHQLNCPGFLPPVYVYILLSYPEDGNSRLLRNTGSYVSSKLRCIKSQNNTIFTQFLIFFNSQYKTFILKLTTWRCRLLQQHNSIFAVLPGPTGFIHIGQTGRPCPIKCNEKENAVPLRSRNGHLKLQ